MKLFFLVVVLAVLGGLWYVRRKHLDEQTRQKAVDYTTTLQKDEQRAREAEQKADAAVKQLSQETNKAVQEADK